MLICDRCRKNPSIYKTYVGGGQSDLCEKCDKELTKMHIVFGEMEKEFMKNKTMKHIDVDWS